MATGDGRRTGTEPPPNPNAAGPLFIVSYNSRGAACLLPSPIWIAHSRKKIRSQDPDVTIVVVGEGDGQKRYDCYLVELCRRCSYFDSMMSNPVAMRENTTHEISLSDIEPSQWELLYGFIVPPINPQLHPRVNEENVQTLVRLFHRFQMNTHLGLCDDFISVQIQQICEGDRAVSTRDIKVDFWNISDDEGHASDRSDCSSNIFNSLLLAVTYGMPKTLAVSLGAISGLLSHLEYTGDLFNVEVVTDLVHSLSPLHVNGYVSEGEGEVDENANANEDPKKMTRDILVKLIHEDYLLSAGGDTMDNTVLSLLVHASIQREAAEKRLWRVKASANCAIIAAFETFPRELSCRLPIASPTSQFDVQTAARLILRKLFYEQSTETRREEYKMIDLKVPESYNQQPAYWSEEHKREFARDALFHCIKSNGGIDLCEAIEFVLNSFKERFGCEIENEFVKDAIECMSENGFISYDKSFATCKEKYA